MVLWNALPDEVKSKGDAFLAEMQTPEGKKQKDEEDIADFKASDEDGDGHLNYEEYKTIQQRIFDKDAERFGDYIRHTEEQREKRFKFMCSLARTTNGPTLLTFAKLKKMAVLWFELYGIKSQLKDESPDESFERTWTTEEMAEVMTVCTRDLDRMKELSDDV